MIFTALDDDVLVAGQIRPGDVAAAVALGVNIVVNNRPDGEEASQPAGAEIEAAARAAGLEYRHIPVAGTLPPEAVAAMADAIEQAEGKLLAFCRSGTRSTYLWALARARGGEEAETLIRRAAAAGYDLASLRPYLHA